MMNNCGFPLQDPLMRRIEGAPMIPSAHALLHDQLPHPSSVTRRNVVFEWIHNFQFRAKKIDVISRRVLHIPLLTRK